MISAHTPVCRSQVVLRRGVRADAKVFEIYLLRQSYLLTSLNWLGGGSDDVGILVELA